MRNMFGTTIAAGKQYIKQGRIQDFALGGGAIPKIYIYIARSA